jgi:Ca-activated chloride channel family protein
MGSAVRYLGWLSATFVFMGSALAGPIFVPGHWKGDAFIAAKADPARVPVAVRFSTTTGTVTQPSAALTITEQIIGPDAAGSQIMLLPLPAGTTAAQITLTLDGAPAAGQFVDATQAADLYATVASAAKLASLVTLTGRPAWRMPARDWSKSHTLVLTLKTPIAEDHTRFFSLTSPVSNGLFGPAPVRTTVDLQITGKRPIRGIISPTHNVEVTRATPHQARVRISVEDGIEAPDAFRLLWAEDTDSVGLRMLTHRIEGEDEGYFLVLGHPTGGDGVKPPPKDLVLVLDTSGSMRGEKMEQAREAVTWTIEQLQPEDRFNIITFGTEVQRFRPSVIDNTATSRAAAIEFIDNAVALGRTNISEALEAGLKSGGAGERPQMMIFLTDGSPTAGEVMPEKILKALPSMNAGRTRVFALGVGQDVNTWLLDQLARQTGGRSVYVGPEEAIDAKVASVYESLSFPLASKLRLGLSDKGTPAKLSKVQPGEIPALFRGQEILITGRFTAPATKATYGLHLKAEGTAGYTLLDPLRPQSGDQNAFVATLWAAQRIGSLLSELRLEGSDAKKVAEIVELSRRFGIVTEYTAFIAAEGGLGGAESATRAGDLLNTANRQRSGNWALNQVDNERKLMQRKVSSGSANFYRDRQGKHKKVQVKQIGTKTYYKRGKQWVDTNADAPRPAAAAPRKTRRVKRFSKAYFDLVKKNKDFAEAQKLEGDMTIDFADEKVEVY